MQLLANARVYSYDAATGRFRRYDSLLLDGPHIAAFDEDPTGVAVERVDCDGATIVPAFADCHVHLTDTGWFLGARNLGGVRTYAQFLEAVANVPVEGGVVLAGQYDESTWEDGGVADAVPLERFHSATRAMLSRVDGHSCIVNRATLDWLDLDPALQGIERNAQGQPTGKLFLEANWRAQSAFMEAISLEQRRDAERRAVDLALANGALHLHAQLVGFRRHEYAREVRALRALPVKAYPKICEPDASLAAELGLPYVGGDVFLDGSLGSRTAALLEPYADGDGCGSLRFSDDELLAYFAQAESLGVAAGVHAIGDAAIEQCVRVWERVLAGKPSPRGCRHFIEHFELASSEQIEACARMGIALSMQPQFDALWGGEDGMYDARLGRQRARTMNALARIDAAGALLCGGDDSPVCALNPLAGMQACVEHHEREERLSPHRALALYTVNAARFGYAENETGNLAPGLAGDVVMLDRDPLDGAAFGECRVLQTWSDGAPVYERSRANNT